jgi:predicted TPR repeat methyltransferase
MTPAYETIADTYAAWVDAALDDPASVLSLAVNGLLAALGPVAALKVCDLGCGEGHLARQLAERSAHVTGVDLSEGLLTLARTRTPHPGVYYVHDDAQHLTSLPDGRFDCVVSNLALMDIPDLYAVYAAVHRVLRAGGYFVFAITHPCFQSPGTAIDRNPAGEFVARRIHRYAHGGFWQSDNPEGIRGKVGAYHRTLATYLNGLIRAEFTIQELAEPTASPGESFGSADGQHEIPAVLVVKAQRRPTHA